MKALHKPQTFIGLGMEDGSWFHGQTFHDSHIQVNTSETFAAEMSHTAGSEVLTAVIIGLISSAM
jgi:hypothetical protein